MNPIIAMQCIEFPNITKIHITNQLEYEYYKIKAWQTIITDHVMYPVKWFPVSKKGLAAKCIRIESFQQYEKKVKELQDYIDYILEEYAAYFYEGELSNDTNKHNCSL